MCTYIFHGCNTSQPDSATDKNMAARRDNGINIALPQVGPYINVDFLNHIRYLSIK